MTTLLANRAQSAFPRSSHQPGIDNQDINAKKRPTTSGPTHQPFSNAFDEAALRTLGSAALRPSTGRAHPRPKTSSTIGSTTRPNTRSASRKLRTNEIESLLRSLERDDTFVVEVDCLANYRTLVDTIDLRRTPMDCQLLCALQQRENQIVQTNACRDARFRSLLDILETKKDFSANEHIEVAAVKRPSITQYPPSDFSYEYVK